MKVFHENAITTDLRVKKQAAPVVTACFISHKSKSATAAKPALNPKEMEKIPLIICSCLMIMITACKSSSFMKNDDETRISITQNLVEPVHVFQITKEKLNIYENHRVVKKNGKTKVKYVHKYSKNLSKKQIAEIDNYLMNMLRLESEYVKPSIGGIAWDISIDFNGASKAILIANKVVPEIFEIFDYINELIPSGKPKIRSDVLD